MRPLARALVVLFVLTLLSVCATGTLGAQCVTPDVQLTVDPPGPDGIFKAHFAYRNAQRIMYGWNGNGWQEECQNQNSCTNSPEWTVKELEFSVACMQPGSRPKVTVGAQFCIGLPYFTSASAEQEVVVPEHTAEVHQKVTENGEFAFSTVWYKFVNSGFGKLVLEWMPQHGTNAGPWFAGGAQTTDREGSIELDLGRTPVDWRLLRVRGVVCADEGRTDSDLTTLRDSQTCPMPGSDGKKSCPTCSLAPVHFGGGTMRFVDSDPIPGGLVRVYDSNKRDYTHSFLGKDWTTFLDANVFAFDDTDRRGTLVFELGDRVTRVFERRAGVYVRTWPEGADSNVAVFYDSSAAETVYRDLAAGKEWRFRVSDGWLTSIRDIATGRATVITRESGFGGKPLRVDDSWGNWAWLVTVDTNYLVTRIELADNPAVAWTFNYSGYDISTIQGPGDALWRTYTYATVDRGRLLSEVRDGANNIIETHAYDYTTRRALDSHGTGDNIAAITYGLPGRVEGESVTEVLLTNGRVERRYVRLVSDAQRVVQVDGGCSSCGGGDLTFAFDSLGRLWREQDARGWVTEYDFGSRTDTSPLSVRSHLTPGSCDPASNPGACRLDPEQLAAASLYETQDSRTVTYSYGDPTWPDRATTTTETSVLVPGGVRTESVTYATGTGVVLSRTLTGWTEEPAIEASRVTTTTYYSSGSKAAFDPGGPKSSWKDLPSQPAGVRKTVDGPRTDVTDVTQYAYYPVDPNVTPSRLRGRLWAVKNAANQITRYDDYDEFGNPLSIVDPNGVTTTYSYNGIGRLVSTTTKGVAGCSTSADPICRNDLTTTRAYTSTFGPLLSEMRPGGGITTYTYDGWGRVATVSRGPLATDLRERIEYTYDPSTGRKSLERMLGFEGGSWVEKKRESFTYDGMERLRRTVHPDNSFVEYGYDAAGNLATVQDENHSLPNTQYDYDAAARLRQVRQTLGGGEAVTVYAYDGAGNLTGVTDPNGNVTTYLYDDFGQMLRQTSPVTGDTTYEYDDAGNLIRTVDARGAVTTRSYDALGRVLQSVTTGEGSSETITWGYDTGSFGIGRMTSMTDGIGTVSYTYDRRGLLLTETRPIEGVSYITKYGYDANGNRTKVTYPSARVVDTTYDWAGRPVTATGKVGNKATAYVTAASYLPFGPMTSMTYGNGLVKSMTYDARYRLDRLTLGAVADYDYGYDNAGNITAVADLAGGAYNRGYGYDDLNRLTAATGPWGGATYTYDAMGSMTDYTVGARSATFAYAGTTPKLVTAYENGASVPVQYDVIGNELTGTRANGPGAPSEQRWYTPRNSLHLVYLSASGTKSRPCLVGQNCPNAPSADTYYEFGYDGRGVRTIERKRSGSTLTTKHYAYTPELAFLGHKSPGRNGTGIEVVWFAGAPVAQEVWATHGQTKWTFTDHLGTPLLQTNSSKAVVWRAEYEPYGNVYAMRTGTKDDQPLRFPGQERLFDGSTGTEERYNIFRWYRSSWGKYTQSDPIGLAGGLNLFAYVEDNPGNLTDPTGLQTRERDKTPKQVEEEKQRSCARQKFWDAYDDMKEANWKLSDKYFHCRANCDATRCGPFGEKEACGFSDFREFFDQKFKGDPAAASAADQAANSFGRAGAKKNPNATCQTICGQYRPKGLPPQY